MATCKDCLHYEVCVQNPTLTEFSGENEALCTAFKDRTKWADLNQQKVYNAHEVAEILAEAFGDTCACDFNGNDEWLSYKCELLSACPNPVGVACWEQYLKHKSKGD